MKLPSSASKEEVFAIERPAPQLLSYYIITSLILGPLFFIPLIPLYFRYHTLRYHLDAEGVHMRWGILFRREINLTYARIQDIHLRSNLIERWLGLARIEIQTASGSAGAEMTLEGLLEYEALRNFLYERMRGAHDHHHRAPSSSLAASRAMDDALAEVSQSFEALRVELRALREKLAQKLGEGGV